MKSPIFSKEKLLYFPQKSSIVPIFRKIPSSYISYFGEYTPWCRPSGASPSSPRCPRPASLWPRLLGPCPAPPWQCTEGRRACGVSSRSSGTGCRSTWHRHTRRTRTSLFGHFRHFDISGIYSWLTDIYRSKGKKELQFESIWARKWYIKY